eukprot:1196395-Prorocentrum_minimum.AAC.6
MSPYSNRTCPPTRSFQVDSRLNDGMLVMQRVPDLEDARDIFSEARRPHNRVAQCDRPARSDRPRPNHSLERVTRRTLHVDKSEISRRGETIERVFDRVAPVLALGVDFGLRFESGGHFWPPFRPLGVVFGLRFGCRGHFWPPFRPLGVVFGLRFGIWGRFWPPCRHMGSSLAPVSAFRGRFWPPFLHLGSSLSAGVHRTRAVQPVTRRVCGEGDSIVKFSGGGVA